jgi:hypothetical protein
MKTVVFEVGLLGFFVSAVVFGAQGTNLFDTIARAFIVFIGIELAATLVLAMIMSRPPEVRTDVHQDLDTAEATKRRGPAVQAKA